MGASLVGAFWVVAKATWPILIGALLIGICRKVAERYKKLQ